MYNAATRFIELRNAILRLAINQQEQWQAEVRRPRNTVVWCNEDRCDGIRGHVTPHWVINSSGCALMFHCLGGTVDQFAKMELFVTDEMDKRISLATAVF